MGFSRQEYWSELSFPSPEELPNPGIEPRSPALHADSLPIELQGSPNPLTVYYSFSYDPFVQDMERLHHGCPIDTVRYKTKTE